MNRKEKRGQFLVEDHRWILMLFASKNPLIVLLFTTPLIALCFYLLNDFDLNITYITTSLLLGFLYWSFAEYLIHRFYFHWVPKNKVLYYAVGSFHHYHHKVPRDTEVINSGPLTACGGAIFHFLILFTLSFGNWNFSLLILAGVILTYTFYEWVHFQVHRIHYKSGIMKYLQAFHLTHHVQAKKNYGQITPVWDYVFRTITPNRDVSSDMRMQSFIKEYH